MSVRISKKQDGGSLIGGIQRTGSVEMYRISSGIVIESAGPNGGKRTQVTVSFDDLVVAINCLIEYELMLLEKHRVPSEDWGKWRVGTRTG